MFIELHCPTCGKGQIEYGEVKIDCEDNFHRTPSHSKEELEELLRDA